jgi:intracellular multiplication protein IcmK
MKVDGVDGRTTVWKIAETVYLRTPLTLLSPAWNASAASADGMNVYTLEDTPVILLSDQGRMVKARIMPDGDF